LGAIKKYLKKLIGYSDNFLISLSSVQSPKMTSCKGDYTINIFLPFLSREINSMRRGFAKISFGKELTGAAAG
jgi:hypothetical protein